MGKIRTGPWKKEPSLVVMSIHPALISEEIFYRANEILNGRRRKMKFHDDKSDLYPLKGLLVCPDHNISLTAHDYQDMKDRLDKEIFQIKEKLTELQQETSPFRIYIQKEVPMLENILEYYRKSDGATRRKV